MSFDSENSKLQDEELKNLAIAAQGHPPRSKERRIALTKLINKIIKSGRLCRPYAGQFGERYDDIYEEAIQRLMVYICQNIDKYKPEISPVMRWVNFYLSTRFFNQAITVIIGPANVTIEPILDDSNLKQPEESPLVSELLWEYFKTDPEQLCQNLRHGKYPQVNFQILALRRMVGEKWKTLSAEFNVPVSTLSDFYQESIKKLSPMIALYLNK